MKLYEIDDGILSCIDAETGEILDVEKLESLQIEREKKLENIALWIKNEKAEVNAIKAEESILKERREKIERRIESKKNYLLNALNGKKLETAKAVVSFRKSQRVEVSDIYALQSKFLTFGKPSADKTEIKKAIIAGEEVHGATLVEYTNISIK